jgi:teichoic acid transport system ATP-binding protein
MYRRTPLRFLAPVALIAFGIAFYTIVKSYSKDDGPTAPSASEQAKERDLGTTGGTTKTTAKKPKNKLPKRTYTVKSGDTLGSISQKTGIPVTTLQELNPNLDPQALSTGQKVKLRE